MSNNENPSNPSNINPSNPSANPNPDPSRSDNTNNSNTSRPDTNTSNTSNNLASRIQSSASNLARSALSSNPSDISSLPGATGTNKPGSGSSRTAAGQTYYSQTGASSSVSGSASGSRTETGPGPGQSSFRSTGHENDGEFEDAYSYGFLGADTERGIEAGTEAGGGSGKGKEKVFEQVWSSTHAPPKDQQSYAHTTDATDGADVLTILASPSFNPDFPDIDDQIPNDLSEYNDYDTGLSPAELQTLDSFRRPSSQLQSQSQSQSQSQQSRINPQSLIPDIDNFLSNTPAQSSETDLRDAVLTGLSGSEDWVSVEERYHDEVWGFLKPVLQAAKREIDSEQQGGQDGQPGQTGEDGPAVARLKMILRHMGA